MKKLLITYFVSMATVFIIDVVISILANTYQPEIFSAIIAAAGIVSAVSVIIFSKDTFASTLMAALVTIVVFIMVAVLFASAVISALAVIIAVVCIFWLVYSIGLEKSTKRIIAVMAVAILFIGANAAIIFFIPRII